MATTVTSYRNFVGGEWVDAVEGETMEVLNPATGETIAEVPRGGEADVERAVEAARRALPDWLEKTPRDRMELLLALARPDLHRAGAGGPPAGRPKREHGRRCSGRRRARPAPGHRARLADGRRRDREDERAQRRGHAQARPPGAGRQGTDGRPRRCRPG